MGNNLKQRGSNANFLLAIDDFEKYGSYFEFEFNTAVGNIMQSSFLL